MTVEFFFVIFFMRKMRLECSKFENAAYGYAYVRVNSVFRTWSPISDAQRMSVRAFDDQVKETPYL